MGGFKIPLDAYIVAVPTVYALCALGGLVYKTLATDPEMTTSSFYEKEEASARGSKWNDSIASVFKDRIKRHQWGVFANDFDVAK